MRKIKFRGKRLDNGEWVYGSLVNNLWNYSGLSKYPAGTPICEIITGEYEGDCWDDIICEEDCIVQVIPETVGQFAGSYDKNGKKIYEGDLCQIMLRYKYGHQKDNEAKIINYPVQFGRISIKDNSLWVYNAFHIDGNSIEYLLSQELEVIGNIYEHPYLIK